LLFVELQKKLRGALLDIPYVQCNGGKHGSGYGVVGGFLIPQRWLAPAQELICPIFPHIVYSTTIMPCKYLKYGSATKKSEKRLQFWEKAPKQKNLPPLPLHFLSLNSSNSVQKSLDSLATTW
jgi:hypothetical protein